VNERPVYERIGVTGTREGLTRVQSHAAARYLSLWRTHHGARELHHGDCLGADAVVAGHASRLGYRLVSHPPVSARLRAFVRSDVVMPPLPYLERDSRIVDTVCLLLALPSTEREVVRSGTWATVRRARRAEKPHVIVAPSGALYYANLGLDQRTEGSR
jgi:hypothetical protein